MGESKKLYSPNSIDRQKRTDYSSYANAANKSMLVKRIRVMFER